MKTITWEKTVGWLLICPHRRPSPRQTKKISLKVICTTEHMSAGPLGSMTAPGLTASRGGRSTNPPGGNSAELQICRNKSLTT